MGSLTRQDLNKFLQLCGQNICSLHYDGDSLKDLRQILQTCAKNLTSLSLWRSWDENEGRKYDSEYFPFKFPSLETLVIVSAELGPHMRGNDPVKNNICNPSQEFLSHIFQTSPNLKSLSARFYDSFILDTGLSFKNLTTFCIKFKIGIAQLRALCNIGLRLKKLRLQRLFIASTSHQENEHGHIYKNDPKWMEFRQILLEFIQTQANTLEYFAVYLYMEQFVFNYMKHDSPYEQWSSVTCFPRMPNLHTFILYECSGRIPKAEFGYLFPKLRNLEIVECTHQVGGSEPPNIKDNPYPMQIPISPKPSIFVQNIRGIEPTLELARIFPSVIELHIVNVDNAHELPIYWPKLKHLYYKDLCADDRLEGVLANIRFINAFLVGISREESEWIEQQKGLKLAKLELPPSRPSILNLNGNTH